LNSADESPCVNCAILLGFRKGSKLHWELGIENIDKCHYCGQTFPEHQDRYPIKDKGKTVGWYCQSCQDNFNAQSEREMD
jgi:hypothetical protein